MKIEIFISFILINENFGWLFEEIFKPVKTTLTKWSSKINDVQGNVNALFSPNVFEVYDYTLNNMSDIVYNQKFNKTRPTIIYIHGWLSNGEMEESVLAIRSAYRQRDDHNFIAIDWSTYSHWNFPKVYVSSIEKLREICRTIATELEKFRRRGYKNFYLVGHSLGAQCCGLIGRHLKIVSFGNFVIPRIYALDPAGPGFEFGMSLHVERFNCISKSDAEYVQIIHTSAGNAGIIRPAGHADFYPNGGIHQPACKDVPCDHSFAWIFFQQSIKDESFLGLKCDSYELFKKGKCTNGTSGIMGLTDDMPNGKFYLRTHPSKFSPALGEDGIGIKNLKIIHDTGVVQKFDKDVNLRL